MMEAMSACLEDIFSLLLMMHAHKHKPYITFIGEILINVIGGGSAGVQALQIQGVHFEARGSAREVSSTRSDMWRAAHAVATDCGVTIQM